VRAAGPVHIAFLAPSHGAVQDFYRAALAAGGKDNGSPGPRPQYHPNYFSAFLLDPDGNNIEAVRRDPEQQSAAVRGVRRRESSARPLCPDLISSSLAEPRAVLHTS
jgi:catechol-2,3-dioxygenase